MKCETCLNLLEEYIDGELVAHEAEQVNAHLITCARCASEFDTLFAEQEIYARYDRSLDISPTLWNSVAAAIAQEGRRINSSRRFSLRDWVAGVFAAPSFGVSFAAAMVVLVALVIGVVYLRTQRQQPKQGAVATRNKVGPNEPSNIGDAVKQPTLGKSSSPTGTKPNYLQTRGPIKAAPISAMSLAKKSDVANQSDVLSSDSADSDLEDQDTARHIEQAQNLLRSFRNLQVSDDADEVDVSYEKALSRRLLNENVVLRRDAETSGKFPVKTLLSDLEPFLIDIANLPDKTAADDLRVIKERVNKTEIVAALQGY